MSRLNSWIDKDQMERNDVAAIIDDDAIQIHQHRFPDYDKEDNLFRAKDPKRELQFLRVLRGRIDRRSRVYVSQSGEVSKGVDHLFIALLQHSDVKIDDVLIAKGIWYTVRLVNRVDQNYTEAELEVNA